MRHRTAGSARRVGGMNGDELAQINIGRLRAPTDAPEVAEFMAALDEVNALADVHPGFRWRLQTEDGNATAVRPYEDETILVNMSVWASIEALADYVYRSAHTAFLRRRREWFTGLGDVHMVLWWVPAGHRPTVAEGQARLAHLSANGPTPHAFTFRHPFGADEATQPADDRNACPA
jgi:Domain of unknown function (DUF3291)